MTIGIYKITNKINQKHYIGQSVNIENRWNKHKSDMYKKSYPLYLAFNKYGIENFSFEIILECTKEELNDKEVEYIEKYDSFYNGYNQTLGGQNPTYFKLNAEIVDNIFNDLKYSDLTQKEIAKKYDLDIMSISKMNNGKVWYRDNEDYPIRKLAYSTYCIDCGVEIKHFSTRCNKCNGIKNRTSDRPSRNELKELIRTTPFTQIGKMYGVTDNAIRKWCDAENLPRTKNVINSYSDEEWELI